jgi:K(+)-stimulated pyrophosphate-energized sodium pump
MHVVSLLALAVQEQNAPFVPSGGVVDDGQMYLWVAMGIGALALLAAFMLARWVIASDTGTV